MWRPGMIPDKTANFNVYSGTAAQANKLAGVSEEFKCPELEFVTETLKMAGFGGEFDSPAIGQLKNMEAEIKFTGLSKDGLKLAANDSEPIIVRAAQEFIDPETGVKDLFNRTVTIRGMTTKVDYGSLKVGGVGDPSIKKSVTCYTEEIDGEIITDINKLTGRCIIAGVDLTEKLQKYI